MVYTPSEDMKTLLKSAAPTGFDPSNVSAISSAPAIRLINDDSLPDEVTNGLIEIGNERLSTTVKHNLSYRTAVYLVEIIASYGTSTSSTAIKEILSEIDRVFNKHSALASRSYTYEMLYQWDGSFNEALVFLDIKMIKEFEAVNT